MPELTVNPDLTQCLILYPTPLLSELSPSGSSDPQFLDENKEVTCSSEVEAGQGRGRTWAFSYNSGCVCASVHWALFPVLTEFWPEF